MTKDVMRMSPNELVDRFMSLALEQDNAAESDQIRKYNRLYGEMEEVQQELKNRPGDQRITLIPLCEHPNAQVRLKAAITLLKVSPDLARETLQKISDQNEYPQAADARGMLRALSDGSYIPR